MDFTGRVTIFTYGTLMKDFQNERVISQFKHDNFEARIDNVEMYNVGRFPALVTGEHSYLGELIVFDPNEEASSIYFNMDMLEGYSEDSPEGSLYLRRKCTVFVGDEPVETEVYLWNRSVYGLEYIDPEVYGGYKDFVIGKGAY